MDFRARYVRTIVFVTSLAAACSTSLPEGRIDAQIDGQNFLFTNALDMNPDDNAFFMILEVIASGFDCADVQGDVQSQPPRCSSSFSCTRISPCPT